MLELEKHLVHKNKELSRRKSPFLNQFILCLNMNCFEPLYTIVKEKIPPSTESHMKCTWESGDDSPNPGSPKKPPSEPIVCIPDKKTECGGNKPQETFQKPCLLCETQHQRDPENPGVAGLWVLSVAVGGSRRRAWTASRRRRWESAPAWRARLSTADPCRRRGSQWGIGRRAKPSPPKINGRFYML